MPENYDIEPLLTQEDKRRRDEIRKFVDEECLPIIAARASACYEAAVGFARKREAFGRSVASFQIVQEKLVTMALEIAKAGLLTYHPGRLLDEHRTRPSEISLAKLNNVREAMKIARLSRDILGARGILADNHVIRHLCDLEAMSTLEGTENIQTLIIGQDLTGIPAFR